MALVAKSPVGLEVAEPKSNYLPEVIFTVGIDKNLELLKLGDRMEYLQDFANKFDHHDFYANLSNDLNKNRALVMAKLKEAELIPESDFLSLYLKIDQETELANSYKEMLNDLDLENKKTKKAKKEQRPQLTPKPGSDGDDEKELKKKQEYVFTPPKLRL